MTAAAPHANERGFSLIELLVAMVITLIVSGAIYGLMAGGQNAFRREPELTERQQNIRLAMDVIMRDIANAGAGLPPFVQVFTPGLDACPPATCPGGGDPGPTGSVRDEFEMLSSTGRDTEPTCFEPGIANTTTTTGLQLVRQGQNIPAGTAVALLLANGRWTMRRLLAPSNPLSAGVALTPCTGTHTGLNFSPEPAPTMNAATLCEPSTANAVLPALGNAPGPEIPCVVTAVAFPRLIRYHIRADAFGVPMLERLTTDDLSGFQVIARGIEELQVQYTTVGDGLTWVDDAPPVPLPVVPVPPANWAALTSQVQVTLTARSEAQNIQGARLAPSGPTAIRGDLTSRGTPRAVLMHVAAANPHPESPSPAPAWYWK